MHIVSGWPLHALWCVLSSCAIAFWPFNFVVQVWPLLPRLVGLSPPAPAAQPPGKVGTVGAVSVSVPRPVLLPIASGELE